MRGPDAARSHATVRAQSGRSGRRIRQAAGCDRIRQRGLALAAALVFLLLMALLGIAALKSTSLSQSMSAGFYDRAAAFEAAQAGINAGVLAIARKADFIVNCGQGGRTCEPDPFTSDDFPVGDIQTVSNAAFQPSDILQGAPQFVVENMGKWVNPEQDTGFGFTANAKSYGAQGRTATHIYYRITARSNDPSVTGGRSAAIVVLQAWFRH